MMTFSIYGKIKFMFQTTNQSNHVKSTFFWVQFRVSSGFFPFFRPDSPQNAQRLGQDPAWAPAAEKWGSNSENGPRFRGKPHVFKENPRFSRRTR
jgi:hypothetical protein